MKNENNHKIRRRAGVINFTNQIPKRVLQISSKLNELLAVEFICWKRFPNGNVNTAIVIGTKYLIVYILKVVYMSLSRRYSVILFDDIRFLPFAVFLRALTGTTLIYNRQEVPTVNLASAFRKYIPFIKQFAWPLAEGIETFLARRVDAVFCIPITSDSFQRLQGWGKPISTIWNVPEISSVSEQKPLREFNIGDPVTLIYCGTISMENGLMAYIRLVRCMYESKDIGSIRLILIGTLTDLSHDELKEIIMTESVEKLIEYKEWIPYNDLIAVLCNEASLGLALTDPSFEKYTHMAEGASRKIFTYMACGLPTIAGGVFGETVEMEGAGYFIKYDDEDALFQAAIKILCDADIYSNMCISGQQAIIDKYNWSIEKRKVIKILNEIVT